MEIMVRCLSVKITLLLVSGIKIMSYREIPGSLKAFCNVTILTSWVMEAAEVWGKERRKPSLMPYGSEKGIAWMEQ
jgi:hypothetical protein